MTAMMPQGVRRVCTLNCGFTAFTFHTGEIPCARAGCSGRLAWPPYWRHICPRGHWEMLTVDSGSPPTVPIVECAECAAGKPPPVPTKEYDDDPR